MPRSKSLKTKVQELRWPMRGVSRREALENSSILKEAYPTPWSVNCRIEDPIHKRLRGGSRPGLTLYEDELGGETIDGMISVVTHNGSNVNPVIATISNESLGVISNGSYSSPSSYLLTPSGDQILTPSGDNILIDSGSVPGESFLLSRFGSVYAIHSQGISVMNLVSGTVYELTASTGTLPSECTHGCFYRDRLVLGGADNKIYFSKQGDPTDWNYGAHVGDHGKSTYLQLSDSSDIGETVTALMPFNDSSLIAATQRSLWLIQGDPIIGSKRNLSQGVGVINAKAWCTIEDARIGDMPVRFAFVFLSEKGLFMVGPTGDGLQSISEDMIPEELIDIDDTTSISLVYSPEERGIYIFLTPDSGTDTHWFFDMVHGSFWPISLQEDHQPLSACWHEGNILLAGKDGNIRYIGGNDDDGTSISSYVLIGPLRISSPISYGMLSTIQGIIASGSGDVVWQIIPGDTAEEACDNGKAAIEAYQSGQTTTAESYVMASGAWTAGRSTTSYPRVRAMWMCILIKSTNKWAYESIIIESRDAGRYR